jgi:hypothetical protein
MSQQTIGPQPGLALTRAGWLALVLSVGIGLGLAVGLKVWWPEKFVPTHRHDPRHQAAPYPFLAIPLVAGGLATIFWYFGYPVLRLTTPRRPPSGSTG